MTGKRHREQQPSASPQAKLPRGLSRLASHDLHSARSELSDACCAELRLTPSVSSGGRLAAHEALAHVPAPVITAVAAMIAEQQCGDPQRAARSLAVLVSTPYLAETARLLVEATLPPVSYTHLTLPTKRIV